MPWTQVGPTDIHYEDRGNGTPLVFIHGALSSAETWYRHVDYFMDRCRVLAYDTVNHGLSSNSPRDEPEPDRVDELEGFLSAVGADRPVLAGQSMGGMTIIRWAVRHPDQARALIISGMGIRTEPRRGPSPLLQPVDNDTLFLGVAESFTPEFYAAEPLLVDRYIRVRSTAVRLEAQRHPREATQVNPAWDADVLAEGAKRIGSPMLIIVGALDNLRPAAERLHEVVSGSRLCVIEGAAHSAHYEKFDEYARLVSGFMGEHGL
ncbi:MAG: alpha/beta hydrolase [Chloroflexi bacterium]|nr:alpha/beta hydrolase [Chloroflexota bacterium]MBV9601650.1 alpha/beta hydrolase [Chloroflexota bacterium]